MSSRVEQKQAARARREQAERADADAAGRRKRTAYLAGGIFVVALVAVVGLIIASQSGSDNPTVEGGGLLGGIEQSGITLGDPNAPVTVVEYADLQCPFCAQFATRDFPGIVDRYVKTGDVKMELRLLGFIGADSQTGRLVAAAAAQQDRIWPFAENVYSNQGQENSGYMTTGFLQQQASGIPGLDASKAIADSKDAAAQRYAAESDTLAQEAGVRSTPTFEVSAGGGPPQQASADQLSGKIGEALAQAKQ